MSEPLDPEDCTTMSEVRAGVDDLDLAIVDLLTLRFGYMEAAARIKPERSAVRDDERKADVLTELKSVGEMKDVKDETGKKSPGPLENKLREALTEFAKQFSVKEKKPGEK